MTRKSNLLKKITKTLLCSMFALSAITATSEASELTAFQSAQTLKTKYNVVNSLGVSNKLGTAMDLEQACSLRVTVTQSLLTQAVPLSAIALISLLNRARMRLIGDAEA